MYLFLAFWGKRIGYFEGLGKVQIVLLSTHIVQKLLFSFFPSILTFDFDVISDCFDFSGPVGLFLVQCEAQELVWGQLM